MRAMPAQAERVPATPSDEPKAAEHGGSLTHDTEPGRTVFRVRLPFTQT